MAKVEDSLPPTPAPRMMATSGDTDDMAKGTNLCKGSLLFLFFFLKKKQVLTNICGVPSTMPSPGVLFAFVCIGGEKGIVCRRKVWRLWRMVDIEGGHPSLRRLQGKWALRESPIENRR